MAEVKRRRRRRPPPESLPASRNATFSTSTSTRSARIPLLKGTEEIDARPQDPRRRSRTRCRSWCKRNLRFVISVAKKYQNRGLPLIDLIGEGNVGLLTAARKFDPDQGVKFISYAVWWIRQAILSSLARQGRTVRVPLNRTADLSRIIKASRDPAPEAAPRADAPRSSSQLTGLSVDVVQSLAALNTGDVRLDAPMDPEGDRSLIERFVADEMPDTEEEAMNRFLTDEIEQRAPHAAAARRQGAASLLRSRRRTRAHARRDRPHARRHPRARPPAARPRAQAAARRGCRSGAGELSLREGGRRRCRLAEW